MGGGKREATNLPANLVALCHCCHAEVESQRSVALTEGWLVGQAQEPAHVPLLIAGSWVLLDDHGGTMAVSA